MPTQIDTTTASGDATATPTGASIVVAPSDASLNVLYFGSNGPLLATAQSPYTAWSSQALGTPTARESQGFTGHSADDNLQLVVTSTANGPYYGTGTRSGNTWTVAMVGPTGDLNNAATTANGVSMWVGIDPQGRLWNVGVDDVLATYTLLGAHMSTGGVWTVDSTLDAQALGEQNRRGLAVAIIGNYLVIVYDSGAGALSYRRLDVSQVTLGSWSAAAAISGISGISTASTLSLRAIPGGSAGMLCYTDSGGIKASSYNALTDAWVSSATLSSATSDRHPVVIPGAAGVVYAVWCQFAAANSYAIVGKAYAAGAWAGSVTTLETTTNAGSNAAWPNGAYLTSGAKLALTWTTATASPWAIQFDAVAAPATTTIVTAIAALGGSGGVGTLATRTRALAPLGGAGGLFVQITPPAKPALATFIYRSGTAVLTYPDATSAATAVNGAATFTFPG